MPEIFVFFRANCPVKEPRDGKEILGDVREASISICRKECRFCVVEDCLFKIVYLS
jgi:hypothetical protein